MNYQEAIGWLFSTQLFGIKLGLENPARLLREFRAFPAHGVKVVHVAGTNGKGSVCAMIDAVARATGRRTGLFTSPHLVDYRERIRVSGEMIPEETCAAYLTELRSIAESMEAHPTFFELTLACGMRWFGERECDLIVLETGMGGRYDATNAVPKDVAVITPIGLDHQQWLGATLGEIAYQKAGILREGVPAVCAPQPEEARRIIEQVANEARVSNLEFIDTPLLGYELALRGPHQKWNAAVALAALHAVKVPMFHDAVRYGLSRTSWAGRFERLAGEPAVILDGAHNPHAAVALAQTWAEEFGTAKATLIFGAVESKDVAGVLGELAPLARRILLVPVDSPRGLPVGALRAALSGLRAALGGVAVAPETLELGGFDEALALARGFPEPVLVAGSLFLVGQARARLTEGEFQRSSQ
jgi:dihydrofolate synthase/folylpolyglutamate synthase